MSRPRTERRVYIDNLRASLVLLLIVDYATTQTLHTSSWLDSSSPSPSRSRTTLAALIVAASSLAKTFVIPTLFAISGYASSLSSHNRSLSSFLFSKTLRLLLPGVVAVLLHQGFFSSFSPSNNFSDNSLRDMLRDGTLSPSLPYLLRLYTYDITYTLLLLLKSHSPVDFPFTLPPPLYTFLTCIFSFYSIKNTESLHWLSLPAYIAGINYLPQLHQYFTQLVSKHKWSRSPHTQTSPSKTKVTPRCQAQLFFLTSIFLSLSSFLVLQGVYGTSRHTLAFLSHAAAAVTTPFSEGGAPTAYAIWASASFVALSTSLIFLYGTHFPLSPSPHSFTSELADNANDDDLGLILQKPLNTTQARTWLTKACTRYVYLQSFVGILVVDAYAVCCLPQSPSVLGPLAMLKQLLQAVSVAVVSGWGANLLVVLCWQGWRMVRPGGRDEYSLLPTS